MAESFGELLYKDIDSNPYLNEIYEAILFNYSLKLFGNRKTRIPKRNIDLSHALRFADILSKSIHPSKAERHKIWAQEIVALLNELYPGGSQVQFYLGSVLMNTGNYRGLKLSNNLTTQPPFFRGVDLLDQSYNEYIREVMKIPADPEHYFFKSQKRVYDSLKAQYFSYSGPTSMGKSFIMRMFIKKQIMDSKQKNFAILVPTKALINEVSSRMVDDLKDLLAQHNYKLVTAAGALVLERQHNFILVLTPERLLYLLLEKQDFRIDYLFVDEAHKISSCDSRSAIYYKVIDLVARRHVYTHIIFSSPNIPNPNVYLGLIPQVDTETTPSIACAYAPVSQTNSALLLGKSMDVAFQTILESDKIHRKSSRVDSLYQRVHFVPLNSDGIQLLKILTLPNWNERVLDALVESETRLEPGYGFMEYDAVIDGRYVLSHLDSDLGRLIRFREGLRLETDTGREFGVVCYPWQAEFLRTYLEGCVRLRIIKLETLIEYINQDLEEPI